MAINMQQCDLSNVTSLEAYECGAGTQGTAERAHQVSILSHRPSCLASLLLQAVIRVTSL